MVPVLVLLAVGAAFGQTAGGPVSFEVVSVKASPAPVATKDDYTAGYNAGMRAALASRGLRVVGRRVNVNDATLKDLIRLAYEVKEYQISGPAWLSSDKFDVVATMPEGAERSQAPAMLRTVLEERFHLKVHREKKELSAYALVVDKKGPKLKAAAAPANSGGGRGWSSDMTGGRHLRANGGSMSALADGLTTVADRPVIDMTGLKGTYDYDLTYSPELSATAEVSGPPLGAAVRDQLGLKLEARKMKVEVLVIDGADKVPTGN